MKIKEIKNMIKKNKGFSLIEILVTLSLIAILSSIAVVNYTGYTKLVELRSLVTAGEVFVAKLNNCISTSGWSVKKVDGTPLAACYKDTTNDADFIRETLEIIGFTCPPDVTCKVVLDNATKKDASHICLDMRKTIRGKNYQLLITVEKDNRNHYRFACKPKVTSYTDLTDTTCAATDTTTWKIGTAPNLLWGRKSHKGCSTDWAKDFTSP